MSSKDRELMIENVSFRPEADCFLVIQEALVVVNVINIIRVDIRAPKHHTYCKSIECGGIIDLNIIDKWADTRPCTTGTYFMRLKTPSASFISSHAQHNQ
jgi:hypothetical protein